MKKNKHKLARCFVVEYGVFNNIDIMEFPNADCICNHMAADEWGWGINGKYKEIK